MSDLFRPNIARLRGYVPGEQPREKSYIKLNTNENPYPPSPLVLARLRDACAADLRLYPDPDAWAVRRKLGEVLAIAPQQIMVGNGSDEFAQRHHPQLRWRGRQNRLSSPYLWLLQAANRHPRSGGQYRSSSARTSPCPRAWPCPRPASPFSPIPMPPRAPSCPTTRLPRSVLGLTAS